MTLREIAAFQMPAGKLVPMQSPGHNHKLLFNNHWLCMAYCSTQYGMPTCMISFCFGGGRWGRAGLHHVNEQLVFEAVEIPLGLQVRLLLVPGPQPLLQVPDLLLLPRHPPINLVVPRSHYVEARPGACCYSPKLGVGMKHGRGYSIHALKRSASFSNFALC